jgi:hypothetical protein
MLVFIDGPDGVGKDTVAKMLHWRYGIPLIDTLSGDVIFKSIDEKYRIYHVIHEYNILKSIKWCETTAIKVRNPVISHMLYHPEDELFLPPIPHSITIILDNGSEEVHKYVDAAELLNHPYDVIKYRQEGVDTLMKVCEKIWQVMIDVEEEFC